MKKCFIVVHRNYAECVSASAFWNLEDAIKAIDKEVETEFDILNNDGYIAARSTDKHGTELYVLNSDIFYEWEIVESHIQ